MIRGFSAEALRVLLSHPWPGNVRELENAIEHAVVLCTGNELSAEHLPMFCSHASADAGLTLPSITLDELERIAILQALESTGGSTARAAELLGVSQRKIQYRLKEWGLIGVWTQPRAATAGHAFAHE